MIFIIIYFFCKISELFSETKKNKWIVLLTMCINPNQQDKDLSVDSNEIINYRKKLYTDVINKWLDNTQYKIYVVESSGYTFEEIKNDRLVVFSFQGESLPNSTLAEANSILYALEKLKDYDNDYTHILKVTGKYYLYDIESMLSNIPDDYDVYIQQHRNEDWQQQNTEYYGIRKELYFDFANTCGYSMESHMYNFTKDKKVMKFPITFSNNIARNYGNIITNL